MPETLQQLPVPAPDGYDTVRELTASLGRKGTHEPGDGLYPRDGTAGVTEIEESLSAFTVPGQERNVVVASGMAAVGGALRYSLSTKGEELNRPAKLAYAADLLYSQSTNLIEKLRFMGVQGPGFNPGSSSDVSGLYDKKKPDVIFAETVSNTPSMPVLDVHDLLARQRAAADDEAPILILDNTLPLSTGVSFDELLTEEDRVLVIESATKTAMHNSENLGVVYSKNQKLIDGFRRYKATEGLVTSLNASDAILEGLEAGTESFHRRNAAAFETTRLIAYALRGAQETLGDEADFKVAHPNLPNHPNFDYARTHLLGGVSPVVFIECRTYDECASLGLIRRIAEHGRVREQIQEGQIKLGQSFGFSETRLLYDPNAWNVRFSGGYDTDAHALADALLEAAADR